MYYNKKHKRQGHLFQDRFKSKIVDTENYLITLSVYKGCRRTRCTSCRTISCDEKLVDGYDEMTAPAINVPKVGMQSKEKMV